MRKSCEISCWATLFAIAILSGRPFATWADEGRRPTPFVYYKGTVMAGTGQCLLQINLDAALFRLTSVQNKYRLVRIEYSNRGKSPIELSASDDRLDIFVGNKRIAGLLNLQKSDPRFWDSLGEMDRKLLAYPEGIEGAKESDQSGYIYAWFAVADISDVPARFEYTIASLGQPIQIRVPPATAARAD